MSGRPSTPEGIAPPGHDVLTPEFRRPGTTSPITLAIARLATSARRPPSPTRTAEPAIKRPNPFHASSYYAARAMASMSRDQAWELLTEWVESPSLRRHCRCVELCMRAYAEERGAGTADEVRGRMEQWGLAGLLHDADWERHPDFEADDGHPRTIMAELERRGEDPAVVRAIASHADYLGVSRDTELERALYSFDELSGFVVACAAVRPEGLHGLTPKSVKKKLKQPSFAAAVNRDDVRHGAEELGVDFDEHVRFVVAALEPHAVELGLDGTAS